jgi:hypothetical protein
MTTTEFLAAYNRAGFCTPLLPFMPEAFRAPESVTIQSFLGGDVVVADSAFPVRVPWGEESAL